MSAKAEGILWAAQRASAAVLAVCVAVHLVLIVYAVHAGLGAAQILGRTRGNVAWLAFYSIFVLAAALHAPIGLRSVLLEWTGWRGRSRDMALIGFGLALAVLGLRAAAAVFA